MSQALLTDFCLQCRSRLVRMAAPAKLYRVSAEKMALDRSKSSLKLTQRAQSMSGQSSPSLVDLQVRYALLTEAIVQPVLRDTGRPFSNAVHLLLHSLPIAGSVVLHACSRCGRAQQHVQHVQHLQCVLKVLQVLLGAAVDRQADQGAKLRRLMLHTCLLKHHECMKTLLLASILACCTPALPLPVQVLSEELPLVLAGLSFKRSMRWSSSAAFSRPLRWLLALHGATALPLCYAQVTAGTTTRLLRNSSQPEVEVGNAHSHMCYHCCSWSNTTAAQHPVAQRHVSQHWLLTH